VGFCRKFKRRRLDNVRLKRKGSKPGGMPRVTTEQHVPTVSVGVGSVKGSVKNAPTQRLTVDAFCSLPFCFGKRLLPKTLQLQSQCMGFPSARLRTNELSPFNGVDDKRKIKDGNCSLFYEMV
jgi:hypothetical protein